MPTLLTHLQSLLTPDLKKGQWRKTTHPLAGHCYVASEALWHFLGGPDSIYKPRLLTHKEWPKGLKIGQTHWFLCSRNGLWILDPTQEQFKEWPPYKKARGCGFLTKRPSKRAAILLERLRTCPIF